VFINGIMLGLTKREITRRFDEIVEFAELEDFIDAPVKTYSSGMYMRLGFAVAIHVDPEVLLIDEVLAVGDEAFTRKCLDKIAEFRRRGKTILFVTHSLGLVEKMCDDALWLRHGRMADRGDPKRVIDAYLTHVASGEDALLRSSQAAAAERAETGDSPAPHGPPGEAVLATGYRRGRWGGREVEIRAVRLLDARGRERHVFVPGETVTLALSVHAASPVTDFVFGVGLFAAEGTSVYGTNTDIEGFSPRRIAGDAEVRLTLEGLSLVEGTYLVDLAAHRRDGTPYDYLRGQHSLRVKSRVKDVGVYRPLHRWSFTGGLSLDPPGPRAERDLGDEPRAGTPPAALCWRGDGAHRPRRPRPGAARLARPQGARGDDERLLRPAAPRARGAPRGGAGGGRKARGGPQLRRLRPRSQGRGPPRPARGREGGAPPSPRGGGPRRALR
jgi:hypothetical protein